MLLRKKLWHKSLFFCFALFFKNTSKEVAKTPPKNPNPTTVYNGSYEKGKQNSRNLQRWCQIAHRNSGMCLHVLGTLFFLFFIFWKYLKAIFKRAFLKKKMQLTFLLVFIASCYLGLNQTDYSDGRLIMLDLILHIYFIWLAPSFFTFKCSQNGTL